MRVVRHGGVLGAGLLAASAAIALAQVPAAPVVVAGLADNGPVITLDEALRRAQATEPAFAALAAEARVAALERKNARAALLPSATFHNQYLFTQSNHTTTTLGTAGGQFDQQGVVQSLPVFIANNSVHEYFSQGMVNETVGLAQISAVHLADAQAAVIAAQVEIARRGLVGTVVVLYTGATANEQRITIAQRALGEADRFVSLTEKRETAREAAHADVIKAQIQQGGRTRELADTRLLATRARLELGVLLFADPATPYQLASPALPLPLGDRAAVQTAAAARNPELRGALAGIAVARAQTRTAQAALLPDLGLNFTYGIDAPQFAASASNGAKNLGYSASATLDIPLWDWLISQRRLKETHIRAQAAALALTAAQRRLIAQLDELWAEADTARSQLASLDSSVLQARESLRLTNLRYVDGESTVLEVVDAQNTLVIVENARVDGAVRYQVAVAQLETFTGEL